MTRVILTPVDLHHLEKMKSALQFTADLAKLYQAKVVYFSATLSSPTDIAHNPEEFKQKLEEFARQKSEEHGIEVSSHSAVCNDLTTDIDDAILDAAEITEAGLIIMQSHIPTLTDYLWPSNGGKVATHSKVSVMLVRD